MTSGRDVHRASTRVLSAAMLVLGVAMLVVTLAGGGGPLSVGVLMGVLFVGAGAARLYLERGESADADSLRGSLREPRGGRDG